MSDPHPPITPTKRPRTVLPVRQLPARNIAPPANVARQMLSSGDTATQPIDQSPKRP